MRWSLCKAASFILLIGLVAPLETAFARAVQEATSPWHERDLLLEVYINGTSTNLIGAFNQFPDGSLAATPKEVREIGLQPQDEAIGADGLLYLDRLPGVGYRIDERTQKLHITAPDALLTPYVIDVRGASGEAIPQPQRSLGAVVDYTLFANSDANFWRKQDTLPAFSAALDGRVFTPYGTLGQTVIASTAPTEAEDFPWGDDSKVTRLNTTWTYSDTARLITDRAGDMITGGLSWTRPVWMGGLQMQRNFTLRPDLITVPLPVISGSAAVPSTLDIYTHNVKTFTTSVPAGPYQVTNLPVASGSGMARVLLRDALGRETLATLPFYTSSQLLKPGLYDFSVELGYPRRLYGVESYDYDDRLMGSASTRYGWSNWLTLEGHAEGGESLINGGAGATFAIGPWALASMALAGSNADGQSGAQISASFETGYRGISFYARTQRTLGDYQDIASVSADTFVLPDQPVPAFDGRLLFNAMAPRLVNQVSLGMPLPFDSSSLNLSYSQIESILGDHNRIVSLSYNRPFLRNSTIFATSFADLDDDENLGVYAGISFPLSRNINTIAGVESGPNGLRPAVSASKSEHQEVGSFGWQIRDSESPTADRSAALSYRTRVARLAVGIQQNDQTYLATGEIDGAIVFMDGHAFLANRIDDGFAVVDVGAPNVLVKYENRPIGKTDSRGLLLVPYLTSYQRNKISIDPANLPVDAEVPATQEVVVPADRSGVMVKFGVKESNHAALVTLVDESGRPLAVGSQGQLVESGEPFLIGYDGQAYIRGLAAQNAVIITLPDSGSCQAEFTYTPQPGEQVVIKDVVCQ
jgi:outer membrane usher protein